MTPWAARLAILALAAWSGSPGWAIAVGQPLPEALEELKESGLRLIYSSALVTEDMEVLQPVRADTPWEALAEILAPHGLSALAGPGGRLVVVRKGRRDALGEVKGKVEGGAEKDLPRIRVVVVGTARWTAVDGSGAFEVKDLTPGRYRIEVLLRDALVGSMDDVEVRSGETTEVSFSLPGPEGAGATEAGDDERGGTQ